MMDKYEAKRLETQTEWNGKVWVCKHCKRTPERFYIVTGHDHTDYGIDWCPCREIQLSAAQAENLRLRDALDLISNTDPDDGTSWFHDVARKALSTPPGDQSALREVIARVMEEAELQRYSPYLLAQKLRSGEWTPEVLR